MPKKNSQQKCCPAFLTQVRSPLFDRASAPRLLLRRRFTEQLFHQIFKLEYVVELWEPLRGCNGCGKMLAVFLMAMIQNKSFFFHNLSRLVPISLNRSLFNNAFRIQWTNKNNSSARNNEQYFMLFQLIIPIIFPWLGSSSDLELSHTPTGAMMQATAIQRKIIDFTQFLPKTVIFSS